jgi:hypothetical protein
MEKSQAEYRPVTRFGRTIEQHRRSLNATTKFLWERVQGFLDYLDEISLQSSRSLRVPVFFFFFFFASIVVAFVFLFFLLGLLSEEDIVSYRPIKRVCVGAF